MPTFSHLLFPNINLPTINCVYLPLIVKAMETVNKVVHAASTAIWGEGQDNQSTQPHGEEPVSGVQGKGAANDPYDAGNRDGK